jgi:hypothetical protein
MDIDVKDLRTVLVEVMPNRYVRKPERNEDRKKHGTPWGGMYIEKEYKPGKVRKEWLGERFWATPKEYESWGKQQQEDRPGFELVKMVKSRTNEDAIACDNSRNPDAIPKVKKERKPAEK